ncbi:MAG: TrbC family F-type conjugative pilus assembly protein [Aeromonas popoffii]|uniref:TrbC family F-type conjugative pilus assembly protein n=1 Tax=Aeromonas popoffii TaxID=70856 RepID=UPI003F2D1D9B
MKKTLLVGLLLSGNCFAAQGDAAPASGVNIDSIAREMAIKAKAIQQQALKDPSMTAVLKESEQITDEQREKAQELTADAMQKAASPQTTQQMSSVFGNMKQSDLVAVLGADKSPNTDKPEAAAIGNGMMFLSLSMSDKDLMASLEVAAKYSMPVSFIGLLKGTTTITDTAMQLRKLARKAGVSEDREPQVLLNPVGFEKYGVNVVPTLIRDMGDGTFHRLEGSINIDYFEDAVAQQQGRDRLNNRVGPIWRIEEVNLIDEMKSRMQQIDWEAKKKAAVANFWRNQTMHSLPPASKDESWMIDPTVRVVKDVVDPSGNVLAKAGTVVNPLAQVYAPLRMIVINPQSQLELEWAKKYREKHPFEGQTMILATDYSRDQGWDVMNRANEYLQTRTRLVPRELIERFHLAATPTVVATSGKVFAVQQFAIHPVQESQQ